MRKVTRASEGIGAEQTATATVDARAEELLSQTPKDFYQPLPGLTKEQEAVGVMYAVQFDGERGVWPAMLVDESEVPLVDPGMRYLYPKLKPGEQRPVAVFETPTKNVIGYANSRGWKIIPHNELAYEDPRAAANTRYKKAIVAIYPYCPAVGVNPTTGTVEEHGAFVGLPPKGEKLQSFAGPFQNPDLWPYEPGKCPRCKTPKDRAEAQKRIDWFQRGNK